MKSWRSFALGLAGAIFNAILPIIQTGTFDIHRDWPKLLESAGIVFFSYVVKDAKATGLPNEPNKSTPDGQG